MSMGNLSKRKGVIVHFDELTAEQREQLRGAPGKDGITVEVDTEFERGSDSQNPLSHAAVADIVSELEGEQDAIYLSNDSRIESREDGLYIVRQGQESILYDNFGASYADGARWAGSADVASSAEMDRFGNYIDETYATKAEVGGVSGVQKVIQFENGFRIESRYDGLYLVANFEDVDYEYKLQERSSGCVYATVAEEANFAYSAEWADEAGLAESAISDTQGRVLKGTEIIDEGDTDVVTIALADGYAFSYGIVSELLNVNTDGEWLPGELTMSLEFTTPSEMPEDYSQIKNVYFKGDSTEDEGYFVPERNTRYTIVFSFNGDMVVGYVSGVPAPSVREVTE